MSRLAVFAVLMASAFPGLAESQDANAWRDSVFRLRAEAQALRDSMTSGDSTVVAIARRGDLAVWASPNLQRVAQRVLDRFNESRAHWFGRVDPAAGRFRIVLRWPGDYGSPSQPRRVPEALILGEIGSSAEVTTVDRMLSRRDLHDVDAAWAAALDELGKLMFPSIRGRLHQWLTTAPPFYVDERQRTLATMYAFVTGPGRAQRNCVAGRIADCAYTVTIRPPVMADPGGGYGDFVRADLLLNALEIGGPDAWARLVASQDERVEDQLSAAAGMPVDSLLARWRERLLAIKPTDSPLTAGGALLLVGWTAVILLGSLAISRWI